MWTVVELEEVREQFGKDFKSGKITKEDIQIIRKWTSLMERGGIEEILKHSVFDDHALDGNWRGHRSSCFSQAGRIIYKEEKGIFTIRVIRITSEHNYKR